jgi:hypothetical protein
MVSDAFLDFEVVSEISPEIAAFDLNLIHGLHLSENVLNGVRTYLRSFHQLADRSVLRLTVCDHIPDVLLCPPIGRI